MYATTEIIWNVYTAQCVFCESRAHSVYAITACIEAANKTTEKTATNITTTTAMIDTSPPTG